MPCVALLVNAKGGGVVYLVDAVRPAGSSQKEPKADFSLRSGFGWRLPPSLTPPNASTLHFRYILLAALSLLNAGVFISEVAARS
jgi:hypothetical protein